MFSDIVHRFDTPLNALTQEREARKLRGVKDTDLVSGNVNRAGFVFPPTLLKQALAQGTERARVYSPDPLGQRVAREAVSSLYRQEELSVPSDQIVITPGTSVSYWYLFKLLANPGDEILCPRPSYPLLDSIAELCGIHLTNYSLKETTRWEIDLDHLKKQITSKTRAIVLISPHNPTGAVATQPEVQGLSRIACEHNLPILSDEVFSPFLFTRQRLPRPANDPHPLVFTLNGVSKMWALPGLKIGWIAVSGERSKVKKSLRALDIVSDTFLPVNEMAQFALPLLFKKGQPFLAEYQKGIRQRAEAATTCAKKLPDLEGIPPEGGFYMTLRLPEGVDEEKLALRLLKEAGLWTHPGYFYDMPGSHLILSFVSPEKQLTRSLKTIQSYL